MSDPFLGEIRPFAGDFAPVGWALCNGQLLPLAQNSALFAILGTTYGGNGQSTFGLPDLRGSFPLHAGVGPGLSRRDMGQVGGQVSVTLQASEIPTHTHQPQAVAANGDTGSPTGATWAQAAYGRGTTPAYAGTPDTVMDPQALQASGGGQPHDNMPPYLTVSYIIALQGIFPPRP